MFLIDVHSFRKCLEISNMKNWKLVLSSLCVNFPTVNLPWMMLMLTFTWNKALSPGIHIYTYISFTNVIKTASECMSSLECPVSGLVTDWAREIFSQVSVNWLVWGYDHWYGHVVTALHAHWCTHTRYVKGSSGELF